MVEGCSPPAIAVNMTVFASRSLGHLLADEVGLQHQVWLKTPIATDYPFWVPPFLGGSAIATRARGEAGSHREAARLFGAAEGIRQRMGAVRFKVYDAGYEASVAALRDTLSENDFGSH